MIPPLFSYQLAVLGLLWLCILLHPVGGVFPFFRSGLEQSPV
jgi:hypothetical protein